jgi:hypothetical protein
MTTNIYDPSYSIEFDPSYVNIGVGAGGAGAAMTAAAGSGAIASQYIFAPGPTTRSVMDIRGGDITVEADRDIRIGERSLKKFMDDVSERLAILQPNPTLEAEWDELKELGEKYRAMERDIKEKMKVWEALKKEY